MPYWITESHDNPGIAYLVQNVQKWIIEPQIDIDGDSFTENKQYLIIEPWTWSPMTRVDQKTQIIDQIKMILWLVFVKT